MQHNVDLFEHAVDIFPIMRSSRKSYIFDKIKDQCFSFMQKCLLGKRIADWSISMLFMASDNKFLNC